MQDRNTAAIYILGDGDRVRERLERYLLNNQLEFLSTLSTALTNGVIHLKDLAYETMQAEVIMAGGDDLLLRVSANRYDRAHLEQMAMVFKDLTGGSFSFGVGRTVEAAYLNLRKAKATGAGTIIEDQPAL